MKETLSQYGKSIVRNGSTAKFTKNLCVTLCAVFIPVYLQAQQTGGEPTGGAPSAVLKTNLLYDATATLNVGLESRLGRRMTLDLPFNYNPWTFPEGRKIKHWLFQPELRYWTKEAFNGFFWGLHLHGAQFNTSGIIDDYRYEGWLAGAGISAGYQWRLSARWGMEAAIGLGYAHIDYTKYNSGKPAGGECGTCGRKLLSDNRHYYGPTKVALSLIYTLGRSPNKRPGKEIVTPPGTGNLHETPPVVVPMPKTDTVPIETGPEELSYRHAQGEALIVFPVNRVELLPEIGRNREELAKIESLIDTLRGNPYAEIEAISIESYASPEGDLAHNIGLSEKRASAVRDHLVESRNLDAARVTATARGENWEGLRRAVAGSLSLTDKERTDILRIIDLQDISARKKLLKEYDGGRIYTHLLRTIYPTLRTCIYRISYTIPDPEIKK